MCRRNKITISLVFLIFLLFGGCGASTVDDDPYIIRTARFHPKFGEKGSGLSKRIKTIAVMPPLFYIREEGKGGKVLDIDEKTKDEFTADLMQILTDKGYVIAEFKQIYLSKLRQNLVEVEPEDIEEVMKAFRATCYTIVANEYDEYDEYESVVSTARGFSYPLGAYSLGSYIEKVGGLTNVDALLFVGVFGYVEKKKKSIIKTIINTIPAIVPVPIFIPYTTKIDFDVALVDPKTGEILWFNHGYNTGIELLIIEIPKKPEPEEEDEDTDK